MARYTDEDVERVARAMFDADDLHPDLWDALNWEGPEDYRRRARAALAARPPADTETLRRVLALADELDAEARGYAEEAERLPSDHPNRYALLGRILGKKASANRIRAALDAR